VRLVEDGERGTGDELCGGAQLRAWIGSGGQGAGDSPQGGNVGGAMAGLVDQ